MSYPIQKSESGPSRVKTGVGSAFRTFFGIVDFLTEERNPAQDVKMQVLIPDESKHWDSEKQRNDGAFEKAEKTGISKKEYHHKPFRIRQRGAALI